VIYIDPYLLLLLIGCLFILVFGGLSFLRREGLSIQFALEAAAFTALLVGGSWVTGIPVNPFLFLVLLYLVTMRSRLVVDIANLLARRGRYDQALGLYQLGLAWWPDTPSRLIVLANRGAAELHRGQIEAATHTLESVLNAEHASHLGLKYEAACRYNLGLAYEQKGEGTKASLQFNQVIDLLPRSPYARAAQAALKRRKKRPSKD
jgi:tetratricopeptide (TPR) repeat protein